MLGSMRAVQGSWLGKAAMGLIFVLIIVGLSFFGFADLFRTVTSNAVAQVGKSEISVDTFRQAYQLQLQQMQQRLRRPVTNAQARQLGLDRQVLSQLVSDAVLDNEAARLGLAVSNDQIAKIVMQDPTFAGQNGQFDHTRFLSLLRDNGMTEQGFLRDQRKDFLRRQIVGSLVGGLTAPGDALEALHHLQAETRSVDLIVLQPSLVGDVPAPDDATLQKYFDDRKQSFAAPEYRKIELLAVTPASVAKPDAITDTQLHQAYDAAPETAFGAPERRTLQQIVFPTQQDAEAAALRIKSGTSFAAIAAERKVDPKDLELGTVAKAALFDKAVADAAFALPADGTSDPIKGTFGTVLVHVVSVEPGTKKPFDEVAVQLRQQLAQSPAQTRNALRDIHDKVEDQRASGKTLAEAAKAAGLTVRTIDAVDATGHDKTGAVVDIPDAETVLKAVFASDPGVDNDVIQTRDGNEIWFEVDSVDAAHQRALADVKPQVEAAWRTDEIAKRLSAKGDELQKRLAGGETMEQVAASVGNAEIRHVNDLRRSGAAGVSQAVTLKAFDTAVNGSAVAPGDNGTRVLFKVLDSVVPPLDRDAPQTKQMGEQYTSLFANDLIDTYLARVEGTTTVKINPQALNSAIGGES